MTINVDFLIVSLSTLWGMGEIERLEKETPTKKINLALIQQNSDPRKTDYRENLDVLKKHIEQEIPLSAMIERIDRYVGTGEINLHIDKKTEAMEALREAFTEQEEPVAFYDFDGYRIEFKDWWFNVRPSNTEPYLRFLAEARTEELLEAKKNAAFEILFPFIAEEEVSH